MKTWLNPKLRVIVFLLITNLSWMLVSWFLLSRAMWLWITPIALSINFLLVTYDQVLSFSRLESQPLVGQDPWGVLKLVHELSERFRLNPPHVFVLPIASAQVFSYTKTGAHRRLFISEGALERLSPAELKAALTYQMCVMSSSYAVLNYWLAAALDLCLRLGFALERTFKFVFGWSPRVSAWFISPWLWLLHHVLLSPRDYNRLDQQTASRIEHPEDLARALWKMEAFAQTEPWAEPWVFAHMCMVSPLGLKHVLKALRIQPPVKARIQMLTGRYPL